MGNHSIPSKEKLNNRQVHTVIINRLNIRPMALSDVADVTQIEQKATPHPWRESQFIDSYEKHHCLALTLDSYVIGYAIYSIVVMKLKFLTLLFTLSIKTKAAGVICSSI